jgi:hypothetical protein
VENIVLFYQPSFYRAFHCTGFSRHFFRHHKTMLDLLVLTWIRSAPPLWLDPPIYSV